MSERISTLEKAPAFLEEMARYFDHLPTNGEDRAHWANAFNAENCRAISAVIKESLTTANHLEIPDSCPIEKCRARSARAELIALGVKP